MIIFLLFNIYLKYDLNFFLQNFYKIEEESSSESEDEEEFEETAEYLEYLGTLDAKEWKVCLNYFIL